MIFPGPSLPDNPTAAQRRAHQAAWDSWVAEEQARVSRQRAAFAKIGRRVRARLQLMMLNRAWELLDAGEAEACDALLEFVEEGAAQAMLEEYFADDA